MSTLIEEYTALPLMNKKIYINVVYLFKFQNIVWCVPTFLSLSLSLSISRFQLDLVVVVKADSLVTTLIVTNKNREDNNSCRHC